MHCFEKFLVNLRAIVLLKINISEFSKLASLILKSNTNTNINTILRFNSIFWYVLLSCSWNEFLAIGTESFMLSAVKMFSGSFSLSEGRE